MGFSPIVISNIANAYYVLYRTRLHPPNTVREELLFSQEAAIQGGWETGERNPGPTLGPV